jgi:hypothetical protein
MQCKKQQLNCPLFVPRKEPLFSFTTSFSIIHLEEICRDGQNDRRTALIYNNSFLCIISDNTNLNLIIIRYLLNVSYHRAVCNLDKDY